MLSVGVNSGRDPETPEAEGRQENEEPPGQADGIALPLTDERARHASLTGGKASALARAAGAGLPVQQGFVVLPPDAGKGSAAGPGPGLFRAWQALSLDGARPLVVRSSSAAEDTAESSMAGQFASVLDVRGWDAFTEALRTVRASAAGTAMAVLVQPMVRARLGGVLFGADPVAGRTDRFLVSVVRGGPDSLVSGAQQGTSFHLSPHGRLEPGAAPEVIERLLSAAELRRLASLARRAAHVFGGPQDIEFGFDGRTGTLWLFQSRPITAMAPRVARRARLLGPGPVAETLPGVLQPLEEDLWVTPMAHGLAAALDVAGAAPRARLRAVPVVSTVEGRAVADLALLGVAPRRNRFLNALNPLPPMRRLAAAWRMGRLHGTLPDLAAALATEVDEQLGEAPPPTELSETGLVTALRWSRATLVALHAQESIAGALLGSDHPVRPDTAARRAGRQATVAACALAALHRGRVAGLDDDRIVAEWPEVLALVVPSLTEPLRLPAQGLGGSGTGTGTGTGDLGPREALRLRIRWVQEFQVRLVREVAYRIADRDGLAWPEPERMARIALLRWPELVGAAEGGPLPGDLAQRQPRPEDSAPLPDAFRLAEDGRVVAEPGGGQSGGQGGGQGVSGGRVSGVVWDGTGSRPAGAVLVVRTLDPALAPVLPRLTALVAQTGSPLSHLAVLARELRLPTVTGAAGAVDRFPPGTRVMVDGSTGEVAVASEARS
jgi:rifampicin phosphotransferase